MIFDGVDPELVVVLVKNNVYGQKCLICQTITNIEAQTGRNIRHPGKDGTQTILTHISQA